MKRSRQSYDFILKFPYEHGDMFMFYDMFDCVDCYCLVLRKGADGIAISEWAISQYFITEYAERSYTYSDLKKFESTHDFKYYKADASESK